MGLVREWGMRIMEWGEEQEVVYRGSRSHHMTIERCQGVSQHMACTGL